MMPPLADIAQHTMFKPEGERVASVVEDGRRRVAEVLGLLEQGLEGKEFLLGADFTAADIMVGYSLTIAKWFGLLGETCPNTCAYLQRLEQRPAYQKALA